VVEAMPSFDGTATINLMISTLQQKSKKLTRELIYM
jgi:hypothetical protein